MIRTKKWIIAALTALIMGGMVMGWSFWGKPRGPRMSVTELDQTLVETYCRLIAAGEYEAAYERCLNADYRGQASLKGFREAQERRRADMGVVEGRELVNRRSSINLFSRIREHQLQYRLRYRHPGNEDSRSWPVWIVVNDADGEWRVEGTYESAASGTLDFVVW